MNNKKAEAVKNMLELLELPVESKQTEQLIIYTNMLYEGLRSKRLTGEKTIEGIVLKQLYDSLYLIKIKQLRREGRIADVGSGGGIPGIPVKIMLPDVYICMIEANRKKAVFIKKVIYDLGLPKAEVCWERAEKTGHKQEHREQYDAVMCKALAEINVLAEICLPFLKVGGDAYFYKGPAGEKEIEKAKKAIELCGGQIAEKWFYVLPGGESRTIYHIIKDKKTSSIYPRATGKPFKNPIT
ncbi:MAG: 16S rRNA (guanine(527)-N(7))-methyltransferase RsmG [Bacillota bacterium]|nr:16S rRNA (guanine(527)-N(7))-methyltransferase RsmG [Bacillota bacterium]